MKLKDCELNIDKVIIAPPIRKEPFEPWKRAYEDGLIPENLYKFYVTANYFSYDSCPLFLKDDENIIFAHVECASELIRESFVESIEIIRLLKDYDKRCYNPLKDEIKNEDQKVAEIAFRRNLQMIFIIMYSILDSTAEVIAATLSWGKVGDAHFSRLIPRCKVNKSKKSKETISRSVDKDFIGNIKDIINKKMYIEECSKDWFALFKLYRNKLSHFKISGTLKFADKNRDYYSFLPRVWPNYIQQHLYYESDKKKKNIDNQLILNLPMEEDVFDYLNGLRKVLFDLINEIFGVIIRIYKLKTEINYKIDQNINERAKKMMHYSEFRHF